MNWDRARVGSPLSHITGFGEFSRQFSKNAYRSNLLKSKDVGKSKAHFKVRNLLRLQNTIWKLKSDGEIAIRYPSVDWVGNEMAIEAHCDGGGVS